MIPKPRTRTRADLTLTDWVFDWPPYSNYPISGKVESVTSYESMTDTVGRATVRPCSHVSWKVEGTALPYQDFVTEGIPLHLHGPYPVPMGLHMFDYYLDLPEESGIQNQILNAFNSFSTVFPSNFAPLEFVEGLRDWRKLMPSFTGDFPKDLSSFYLGQKWGRDQLFSDIGYLSNLLATCKARLDWLRRTYGKPTPLYYREALPVAMPAPFRYMFRNGSWGLLVTCVEVKLMFSARATLLHRIPFLDSDLSLFQAVTSALGTNNPLKAIWQNMPFSFLVDWVFNVSGLLDRLAQIKPAAEWQLYDVCHSVKMDASIQIDQDNHWSGGTSDNVPLARVHLSRYRRSLGLPLVLTDLIRTSFSPNQQLALTALLTSTRGH